jgi:hypothetical protein
VLDALKFDEQGAEEILRRLLAGFKGELLEKVPDSDDEDETSAEPGVRGR